MNGNLALRWWHSLRAFTFRETSIVKSQWRQKRSTNRPAGLKSPNRYNIFRSRNQFGNVFTTSKKNWCQARRRLESITSQRLQGLNCRWIPRCQPFWEHTNIKCTNYHRVLIRARLFVDKTQKCISDRSYPKTNCKDLSKNIFYVWGTLYRATSVEKILKTTS